MSDKAQAIITYVIAAMELEAERNDAGADGYFCSPSASTRKKVNEAEANLVSVFEKKEAEKESEDE